MLDSKSPVSGFYYALNRLCYAVYIYLHFTYIYPYQKLLVIETQSTAYGFCYALNRVFYAVYL